MLMRDKLALVAHGDRLLDENGDLEERNDASKATIQRLKDELSPKEERTMQKEVQYLRDENEKLKERIDEMKDNAGDAAWSITQGEVDN